MALSLQQYSWSESDEVKDILLERLARQRELSSDVLIGNLGRLPENLVAEILSWMPVRTLLQFKSVCKLWYSIIKSSHFISKHLENYYTNDRNWRDCLILQDSITQARELAVYELLVDFESKELLSYQVIRTPEYNTYMCGPCNGIYLLWQFYFSHYRSLWNPALNELVILPKFESKPNLPSYMTPACQTCGFGFDSKTNDYKVIVIEGYNRKEDYYDIITDPLSIYIYSVKGRSWRYWGDLKKFYYLEDSDRNYDFVNGCYYWLGSLESYGRNYVVVLSFDISADAFEEIPLPEFEKKPCWSSELTVYHDSIAFVCVPEDKASFSIWTWNERVWTQKFTMELWFQVSGPFCFWSDDMLVFRERNLVLCDTHTKEMWDIEDPRCGYGYSNIIVYKESLVSIKEIATKAQHQERSRRC